MTTRKQTSAQWECSSFAGRGVCLLLWPPCSLHQERTRPLCFLYVPSLLAVLRLEGSTHFLLCELLRNWVLKWMFNKIKLPLSALLFTSPFRDQSSCLRMGRRLVRARGKQKWASKELEEGGKQQDMRVTSEAEAVHGGKQRCVTHITADLNLRGTVDFILYSFPARTTAHFKSQESSLRTWDSFQESRISLLCCQQKTM